MRDERKPAFTLTVTSPLYKGKSYHADVFRAARPGGEAPPAWLATVRELPQLEPLRFESDSAARIIGEVRAAIYEHERKP